MSIAQVERWREIASEVIRQLLKPIFKRAPDAENKPQLAIDDKRDVLYLGERMQHSFALLGMPPHLRKELAAFHLPSMESTTTADLMAFIDDKHTPLYLIAQGTMAAMASMYSERENIFNLWRSIVSPAIAYLSQFPLDPTAPAYNEDALAGVVLPGDKKPNEEAKRN
ncbi:MAG: hypothetical protein M0R33_15495 [Methylomonas sp.]|jgi:hypothetical protein|uniref:hypothetical protein n=1 Tax=Methylomonas sp. TaxID=418 RepID=UPI0025FD95A8|nr:hypothetical protein [Methylomonas sp.]MCK9607847.1 hypothetical protein [Methylomonas sp.]